MKKFSFRCISCGCIATVALSLPLIATAGTKNADAEGNNTTQVAQVHSGSGSLAGGSKKARRTSQGTHVAGTQSGGKKGKQDKTNPSAAGTKSGSGGPVQTARSAAVLSDLRLKNNISFVGWSPMGIPIYRFSYTTEPNKRYQGTIAQALILVRPDAVVVQNGLMFVDYSQLDIAMEELPR